MDNIQWNTETQRFEYCGRNTKWHPSIDATFAKAAKNKSAAICHRISFKTIAIGILNCLNCFFLYLATDDEQRPAMDMDNYTCLYRLCGMIISVKNLRINESDLNLETILEYVSSDPRYKKILDAILLTTDHYLNDENYKNDKFVFSRPNHFLETAISLDLDDEDLLTCLLINAGAPNNLNYSYVCNFMSYLLDAGTPDANSICLDIRQKVCENIEELLDIKAKNSDAQAYKQNLITGIQEIISRCEQEIKPYYTDQIYYIGKQYENAGNLTQQFLTNHGEPHISQFQIFNNNSQSLLEIITGYEQVIKIYTATSGLLKYILKSPYDLKRNLKMVHGIYSDPNKWNKLVNNWNRLNNIVDEYYFPLDSGMSFLAHQASQLLDLLNSEPANLKLGNKKWNNSLQDSYDCEIMAQVSRQDPLVLQLTSDNDCTQLSNLMNLTIGQVNNTPELSCSTEDGLYMYACILGDSQTGLATVYTSSLPEQEFYAERSDLKKCRIEYKDYFQNNELKPLNIADFPENTDTGNAEEDEDAELPNDEPTM